MRNIKLDNRIKFCIGVVAIAIFVVLLPYITPQEHMEINQKRNIDAGALFYSESPHALTSAYQMQKRKQ